MKYFDECIAVLSILEIVICIFKNKVTKMHYILIALMIALSAVGLISNYTACIQTEIKPILNDLGNTFKVFVIYIGSSLFLSSVKDKKNIVHSIAFFIKIFVVIAFICMVLHELNIINMGTDVRYGMKSFQFINDVAGQLSLMMYSVMFILTLDLVLNDKRWNAYIFMALLIWVSTLRARAFMFVLIYLFLYWMMMLKDKRFKLNIKNAFLILGSLALFGYDQFTVYFQNDATARLNLMTYGIKTMKRFFPLGSGFATYGTDAAAKYYSNLYYEYGFQNVYGLSKDNPMFAHDNYWPAIFAEFGIIGTILMMCIIFNLFRDIFKKSKYNNKIYFIAIFICITQIASSLATATFFHYVTASLFFMVPLLFNNTINTNNQLKKEK